MWRAIAISIHRTPRDRWSGGPAIMAGVLDKSLELGPVGICGTAPLWTTCRTTYGGQTVWQVVTAVLKCWSPMSAIRTKRTLTV